MVKVHPEGIISRRDGDEHKKFPNGLKATLKAIRKFWSSKLKSDYKPGLGRTPPDFAREFFKTYNGVGGHYRSAVASVEALESIIKRLESSGKVSLGDINFAKLRAYAEFVELPSSMLLLFGQMTSYEAQGRSRTEIANFLNNCANTVQALQQYVGDGKGEPLFHKRLSETDSEVEFVALLRGLYEMSAAFGGWSRRLQPNPPFKREAS